MIYRRVKMINVIVLFVKVQAKRDACLFLTVYYVMCENQASASIVIVSFIL